MCLCILDSFHSPSLLQFNLGRQIDHAALMKKSNISKHTHIVGVVICTCRQGSCGSTCSLYALGSYVHPFEALQVSTYHLRGPSILPRVLPCELQSCSRAPIRPGGLENRNEASARRREYLLSHFAGRAAGRVENLLCHFGRGFVAPRRRGQGKIHQRTNLELWGPLKITKQGKLFSIELVRIVCC